MSFKDWFPLVTALVGSFAVVAAVYGIRVAAIVNIRNKRLDVILHCNSRYDDLYKFRIDIESAYLEDSEKKSDRIEVESHIPSETVDRKKINLKTEAYFRRFWGLKIDQLDYWFAGYVDPESICSWFCFLAEDMKSSDSGEVKTVCGVSYKDSWALVKPK